MTTTTAGWALARPAGFEELRCRASGLTQGELKQHTPGPDLGSCLLVSALFPPLIITPCCLPGPRGSEDRLPRLPPRLEETWQMGQEGCAARAPPSTQELAQLEVSSKQGRTLGRGVVGPLQPPGAPRSSTPPFCQPAAGRGRPGCLAPTCLQWKRARRIDCGRGAFLGGHGARARSLSFTPDGGGGMICFRR